VETKLTFNTNLKEVKAEQEGILSQQKALYNSMVYYEGAANSVLGDILQQRRAWEIVEGAQSLSRDQLGAIGDQMEDLAAKSKKVREPFELMMGAILPGFNRVITPMVNRFESIGVAMRKVAAEPGGFMGGFTDYISSFSHSVEGVTKGIQTIFGGGMQGMVSQMGVGIKALTAGFSGLFATLLPLLPFILGIIAVVFVLQRMWINNVGGMQTKWFQFTASIRDTWYKFVAQFDSAIRTMGPLISAVLTPVFLILSHVVKSVGLALRIVMEIAKPGIEMIAEFGKALTEPFKAVGIGGKDASNALDMILKAVEKLIPALVFLVKIVSAPLKLAFMVLAEILKPILYGIAKIIELADRLSRAGGLLGGVFKGKSEEEEKEVKRIKSEPTSMSQIANNQRSYSTNANVSVYSAGPITEGSAPGIGNIIAGRIISDSRAIGG